MFMIFLIGKHVMSNQKNVVPDVVNQIPAIYTSLHEVQKALSQIGIGKNHQTESNNTNFKNYSFRGIDDVYNTVSPLLAQFKILCIPSVEDTKIDQLVDKYGKVSHHTRISIIYKFFSAIDASSITINMVGEAIDGSDKGNSKAMSMAYKYCFMQLFCIPTQGNDHDPDQYANNQYFDQNQRFQDNDISNPVHHNNNQYQKAIPYSVSNEQLNEFINILGLANCSFERFLNKRNITREQLTPELLYEESQRCVEYINNKQNAH